MLKFLRPFCLFACIITGGGAGENQNDDTQIIEKENSRPSFKGDSNIFSGEVRVTMLFENKEWREFGGALVEFSPNARSAWHTHPAGQTLIVTEGEIITQVLGEKASVAKKGDVISCPPNIKHWHGARNSKASHIALTGYRDGKNVEWLELVSDEDYQKAIQDTEIF